MVVVVLLWRVVVSSQYDGLVFVVMVRRLFVLERFERAKHKSKKKNIQTRNFLFGKNINP